MLLGLDRAWIGLGWWIQAQKKRSIRHHRGWQFIPLVLFVLVLEEKYWDLVGKKAKYRGFYFPEKVIDLNRIRRFRGRSTARLSTKKPSIYPRKYLKDQKKPEAKWVQR
jgi:hypothetical protein